MNVLKDGVVARRYHVMVADIDGLDAVDGPDRDVTTSRLRVTLPFAFNLRAES